MEYPYINFYGHKLSLIYPYTLDNQIIIDFQIIHDDYRCDYDDYNNDMRTMCYNVPSSYYFKFKTINNDIVGVTSYSYFNGLSELINRNLQNFIIEHRYDDRTTIINILREVNTTIREIETMGFDYAHYLFQEISHQCDYLSRNLLYRIDQFKRILDQQGRTFEPIVEHSLFIDALPMMPSISSNMDISSRVYITSKKYIHPYNYIPKYEKHYMKDENTTTLLLGAEIEVDKGGQDNEEVAKECLRIMNGNIDSEKNIYCVHDGSLPQGFELPTMPGTLAYHKTLPYKELFNYLDSKGYKSHDTTTCGLHIHINRDYFKGQSESEYAGKLIYITEKFNDEFSILARRDCTYARFIGYSNEKCKEIYDKSKLFSTSIMSSEKYKAVNLQHKDTIELRSFKGTLKYSTFINTLEFVSCLATFVRDHSEEEVEDIEWSDLYNTFSDGLKKYYDERKEYELEKLKNNKKKESNNYQTGGLVIWDSDIMNINNITIINNQDSYITETGDFINTYDNPRYCTDIKIAQKVLKKFKKELKYERNHMQKKILGDKISELNKRIKELKRAKRNNVEAIEI